MNSITGNSLGEKHSKRNSIQGQQSRGDSPGEGHFGRDTLG